MATIDSFNLQKDCRDMSNDIRNELTDLLKWEQEIKQKEKKTLESVEAENEENLIGIRSHIAEKKPKLEENNNVISTEVPQTINGNIDKSDTASAKEIANSCKDKGNSFVKLGEYEKAIEFYTEAIENFESDPIFYTNRALCYLKIERYNQCIEDCNKAISLNENTVKAFYRRMQANESLGEHEKALNDCEIVLRLDPKNIEGKRSLERIKTRLDSYANKIAPPKEPTWESLGENMEPITGITKAPHLRSKKPLQKIKITETCQIKKVKDNKNTENKTKNVQISDEIFDKLFNHNDIGNYTIRKSKNTTPTSPSPTSVKPFKSISSPIIIPAPISKIKPPLKGPVTTCEFYATWKELSQEDKYSYFMKIETSQINRILGAGFDSSMLSDILQILSKFGTQNKSEIGEKLAEISNHSELSILSMFLSAEDHHAINDVIKIIELNENSKNCINVIKTNFGGN